MAKKQMIVKLTGDFCVFVNGNASRTSAIADAFKKFEMAFPDGIVMTDLEVEDVVDA